MSHSYLVYNTPEDICDRAPADTVRLGDSLFNNHNKLIGPIMKIELDWKNDWATFTDTMGNVHQCMMDESLRILRK